MTQDDPSHTSDSRIQQTPVDALWLGEWLTSFQAHAEMQTRSLRRIAGVATLVAWMIVISLALSVITLVLNV